MFQLKWDMKISIISVDSCRFYRYYSLLPTFIMERNTAAAAKSLQSCPTLCDPIGGSPLGSSAPGVLQARILEWVAISFSNALK